MFFGCILFFSFIFFDFVPVRHFVFDFSYLVLSFVFSTFVFDSVAIFVRSLFGFFRYLFFRFSSLCFCGHSCYSYKGHSYRRAFCPDFRHFFRASFQSSIFSCFFCFPNIGMLTNLIFLVLENITNNDRTPPYIDTYLQLFPNFGNYGKNALR